MSSTLGTLKVEACAKESVENPNFRNFIETIGGNFDLVSLDLSGAKLARPFLTPLAWAYYSAYSLAIIQAVAVMHVLKIGVDDPGKYLNLESANNLLKTVLPSQQEYIDKHGMSVHCYLLDDVEQLLLMELRNIQEGREDDKDNAQRAAEINKVVEKVSNEVAKLQAST